ncbi:Exosome component 10 [Trichinella pseudospiralis]|uniref:Exosome component 10 n=1 Tax=Trichinella pseudospiralis TaxID=6337 RepID=A0A0V1IFX1_TRIPS|nr:Exosome component 10 [Trichinella pseudospiralis]
MVWSLKLNFPSNLVYMCCIANFINAVDRIIMPIAIVELAEEMKYGIYQQGWVLSAFSAGYIGSQATLPGLVVGPLTADFVMQSSGRWGPVFILAAMLNLVGSVIYLNYSSTKHFCAHVVGFCITICSTVPRNEYFVQVVSNMSTDEVPNIEEDDDDQSSSDLFEEDSEALVELLRQTTSNLLKKFGELRVGDRYLLKQDARALLVKASFQLLELLNEAMTYISATFPKMARGTHHMMMMDEITKINDILDERITSSLDEVRSNTKECSEELQIEGKAVAVPTASWNCINVPSKKTVEKEQSVENLPDEKHSHKKHRFIVKPQMKFQDQIDNSLKPFKPKLRKKHHAITLEKLSNVKLFVDGEQQHADSAEVEYSSESAHPYYYEIITHEPNELMMTVREPQRPIMPLNACELVFVKTKKALQSLVDVLNSQQAFAVDLEHNSYRSYYGLTCLLQFSTRDKDYIVDPFPIWREMHILNEPFTDPNIVKVMHGSASDIQWLQRDFGIYVVNLFDTYHAMDVLGMPQRSLKFLVKELVGVNLDKSYQLSDWRIRPIGAKMLAYARSDSHYLLYCWDVLRNRLLDSGNEYNDLMMIVLKRSNDTCLQVYKKKFPNELELKKLELEFPFKLNDRQKYVLQKLYYWRDGVARITDESVRYIMKNETLKNLAAKLPRDMQLLENVCRPVTGALMPHLHEIQKIICDACCIDLFTMKLPKEENMAVERSSVARRRPHDVAIDGKKKELTLLNILQKSEDETLKQLMHFPELFEECPNGIFYRLLLTSQWYAIDPAESDKDKDERLRLVLDDFAILGKYYLTKEIRDVDKPEPATILWDIGYSDQQRKTAEKECEIIEEVIKIQSANPDEKAQQHNDELAGKQQSSSSSSTEKRDETWKAFYKPYDYSTSAVKCFKGGGSSASGDSTETGDTVSASKSALNNYEKQRNSFCRTTTYTMHKEGTKNTVYMKIFFQTRERKLLKFGFDSYTQTANSVLLMFLTDGCKIELKKKCDELLLISQATVAEENKSGDWNFVTISRAVESLKHFTLKFFLNNPKVVNIAVIAASFQIFLKYPSTLLRCLTCNTLNINGKWYIRRHIGEEKMINFAGRSLFLNCAANEILSLFQIGKSNFSANTEWYERTAYGLEKVVFHENQIFWNYAKSEYGMSIRSLKRIENRIGYRCRIISNELQLVVDKDFDVEALHCHAKDVKSKRFCGYGNCIIEKEKFNYTFMKCVCEPGYSGLNCSYRNSRAFLYKWLTLLQSSLLPVMVSFFSYCFVKCLEDRHLRKEWNVDETSTVIFVLRWQGSLANSLACICSLGKS